MKKIILVIILATMLGGCNKDSVSSSPQSFEWPKSTPEKREMNSELLNEGLDKGNDYSFLYGLAVIKDGYLVAEKYYQNTDQNDAHLIRSVSKSFLSAIVGIALEQGILDSLNMNIFETLDEYKLYITDHRMQYINMRHLLTMTSGIPGDREIYSNVFYSQNWGQEIAEQQLLFSPGTNFQYSTSGTHLLSIFLSNVMQADLKDFAQQHLFEPLGISLKGWATDPQGYYFGGNNMKFTPRDMARLGWLYMNGGKLNGQQIVPQDWVKHSWFYHHKNRSSSTWGPLSNSGYGYLWWMGHLKGHQAFMAIGHGGQFIVCVPDLNLVVTSASNSTTIDWNQADYQERTVLTLIADYIIAAAL